MRRYRGNYLREDLHMEHVWYLKSNRNDSVGAVRFYANRENVLPFQLQQRNSSLKEKFIQNFHPKILTSFLHPDVATNLYKVKGYEVVWVFCLTSEQPFVFFRRKEIRFWITYKWWQYFQFGWFITSSLQLRIRFYFGVTWIIQKSHTWNHVYVVRRPNSIAADRHIPLSVISLH